MKEKINVLGKCPSCGAPNSRGGRFCDYCGTWLGAAESAPEKMVPEDVLPGWDDGLGGEPDLWEQIPQNSDIVSPARQRSDDPSGDPLQPVASVTPEPDAPGPAAGSRKPSFWGRMKKWRMFLPVWTVFCILFSFLPFLNESEGDGSAVFVLTWLPGIIFYALLKRRSFTPPSWPVWIIELLTADFLLLLINVGRSPADGLDFVTCLSFIFFLVVFVAGIIWKIKHK